MLLVIKTKSTVEFGRERVMVKDGMSYCKWETCKAYAENGGTCRREDDMHA